MTLREMARIPGMEDPLVRLMACLQVLRTAHQGEAATLEGCCASLEKWLDHYKELTDEAFEKWMTDLGEIADLDIPDSVVWMAVNCD